MLIHIPWRAGKLREVEVSARTAPDHSSGQGIFYAFPKLDRVNRKDGRIGQSRLLRLRAGGAEIEAFEPLGGPAVNPEGHRPISQTPQREEVARLVRTQPLIP